MLRALLVGVVYVALYAWMMWVFLSKGRWNRE